MAGALVLNALLALLFDSKVDTENSESGEQLSSEEDGQRRKSKRFTFHCSVWKVPSVITLTITGVFFMFGRSIIYVLVVGSSTPLTNRMRDPNMCVSDQPSEVKMDIGRVLYAKNTRLIYSYFDRKLGQ